MNTEAIISPRFEKRKKLVLGGTILKKGKFQSKYSFINVAYGEGNGNPLQYSCLENPRDRGVWWAAVYGLHRVGHN